MTDDDTARVMRLTARKIMGLSLKITEDAFSAARDMTDDKLTTARNLLGDLAFEEDFRSDNPDVVYRMIYEKTWHGQTMRCRKWFGTWRAARAFRDRLCRDGDTVVSITCYDADPECDLPTTLEA